LTELIARIKALLRHPGGVLGITLDAGNVRLDTVGRDLTVAEMPVNLSRRELAILEQMMRRFGRIVPKAVLEEKLYGIDEEPDSNPIPDHFLWWPGSSAQRSHSRWPLSPLREGQGMTLEQGCGRQRYSVPLSRLRRR
jgi:hypothetical protein